MNGECQKKMKHIIYQTIPRVFGNFNEQLVKNGRLDENGCGKFNSYTLKALASIRELGVTHVWYTGIIAHATCTDYSSCGIPNDHPAIVKGAAGSPYAIKDYYDVDPDLADDVPERMNEFEALIQRTHDAGMKVIIDFVPNHVSRMYRSLKKPAYIDDLGQNDDTQTAFARANNYYYIPGQPLELHFGAWNDAFVYSEFPAKATGNDCFHTSPGPYDWYETVKLNYGVDYQNGMAACFSPVPDTWHKMLDILLFWAGKDVDGFRCDMAEMVPLAFWNWVIPQVKSYRNVLFIAETYHPESYRDYIETGKFDYLYDKVGMYDTLRAILCGNMPATRITPCWQALEGIQDHFLFFLENHDEQRIASAFFADNPQVGIPGLALITMLNKNPVLIYNGQELGEKGMDEEGFSGRDGKTTIFDYWSMTSVRAWANNGVFDGGRLDDEQRALRLTYQKILQIATGEKAIALGRSYGLAYCNIDNPDFPSEIMVAGLRQFENELILVVINFGKEACPFRVHIPKEAFDFLQIPDNTVSHVKDLLSGEESICALTYVCPYQGHISAYSAKILKFNPFFSE